MLLLPRMMTMIWIMFILTLASLVVLFVVLLAVLVVVLVVVLIVVAAVPSFEIGSEGRIRGGESSKIRWMTGEGGKGDPGRIWMITPSIIWSGHIPRSGSRARVVC